jgi:glycerophosphoryl diester phosphodiesterase
VAQARLLGLRIFPWTVNEVTEFQRLAPMVDGIITDFPSRFVRSTGRSGPCFGI